jgi:TetR/AcrR family transcriptional regulator, mexJK operon transcriptional repressor
LTVDETRRFRLVSILVEVARPAGSRRSAAKRQQILDAATHAFLADGYARTSVDSIAAAAGVGKQTVYSHFDGKRDLFLEVVARAREVEPPRFDSATTSSPDLDPGGVADQLTQLVVRVLSSALDPTVAALHRLTIAELPHHPELQQMWRDDQDFPEQDAIEAALRGFDELGVLDVPEPRLAAHQLVLLAVSEARVATLWGTRPLEPATSQQLARRSAELIVSASRPRDSTQPDR